MNQSMDQRVDVKENALVALDAQLLNILLKDKAKEYERRHNKRFDLGSHIVWATDDYLSLGEAYACDAEITVEAITGANGNVIRPRIEKSKDEQELRVKSKAEVFTPSWVCNKQNNLIDNAWFGRENVFNIETENGWLATTDKIVFPTGKTWQMYVVSKRLEISCGEAPYLTSRYDAVSGEPIPVEQRIGLLDRKLRVICENCDSEQEWMKWAMKAFQSVYGYDWQGDNVLLARENLLYTFADYYAYKFVVPAHKPYLKEIAQILAWNIWQMDGIKCVIPNSCQSLVEEQSDLLGEISKVEYPCPGCVSGDREKHNGIYCRVFDWTNLKKSIPFISLFKGDQQNGKI